jgi:uncharacterized membrane protein YczE
MLHTLSELIGQVAHIIGMCLMIYAVLLVLRGFDRGDMVGAILKAFVMGLGSALLMRL